MEIDPTRLTIVHYPDPVLRRRAAPLEHVDETVRAVAARMIELMHEAEGVGLAGPQVGLSWRLFVARDNVPDAPVDVFVNPVLDLERGPMVAAEEGCLSLPDIRGEIRRAPGATIRALDLAGRSFEQHAEGFLARVWQHEYDHIEGVLIIDRMSPLDRLATRRALKALEAEAKV
jgi:peptide deformylase